MNLLTRIAKKYRREGLYGLKTAALRNLLPKRQPKTHPLETALEEICRSSSFSIVQIGAHVGNTSNDPLFQKLSKRLHETQGRLICVEPVSEYYAQLVENYRGLPNVSFENVAISDHTGPATFYRLGVDPVQYGFPPWLSQLGSLKKERMLSLWKMYEADNHDSDNKLQQFYLEHRIEEKIQCITFEELMHRHDLHDLDLLQMDVEGYELEILRTIDFAHRSIRFVNYESALLNRNKAVADRLMRTSGYSLLDYGQDTLAYKREDKHLIQGRRRT